MKVNGGQSPQRRTVSDVALRAVIDTLTDPLVLLEPVRTGGGRIVDFMYVEANAAACEFEGIDYEQFVGNRMLTLRPGNREAGTFDSYANVVETGETFEIDDVTYEMEGSGDTRAFDVRAVLVDGLVSLTWRDVTARHERVTALAESEERYRLLAENSSDVVMRSNGDIVEWVSPALEPTLGWAPEDWIGQPLSGFGHPDDFPIVEDALYRMIAGDSPVIRIRLFDKGGAPHWVDLHCQTYVDADGCPNGVLSSFRTVDSEVASALALERLARFDALTGLLNRGEALNAITAAGTRRRRPGARLAVLFCDVDRFKDINDSYGHAAGDEVLRQLAARISGAMRRGDCVARFGGDEFIVLLDGVHDLDEASGLAEKVRTVALAPVGYEGASIRPTLSIGVALAEVDENVERLLCRADKAMYEAKHAGRNRVIAIDATEGWRDLYAPCGRNDSRAR